MNNVVSLIECGDCLDVLTKAAPDEKFRLIVTSPPYADRRKDTYGGIHPDKYVEWFLPRAEQFKRVLAPDGSFILNIKEKVANGERHTYVIELILALRKQGWMWTEEYIWHKKNCVPGKWPNRFRDAWERCLHFTKQKEFVMNQEAVMVPIKDWAKPRLEAPSKNDNVRYKSDVGSGFGRKVQNWVGRDKVYPTDVLMQDVAEDSPRLDFIPDEGYPNNVIHSATECGNKGHSAAFPDSLPEWFIKLFSNEGDWVLDPFVGSGTTCVVAKRLKRNSLGVELKPEFYTIAKNSLIEKSNT